MKKNDRKKYEIIFFTKTANRVSWTSREVEEEEENSSFFCINELISQSTIET